MQSKSGFKPVIPAITPVLLISCIFCLFLFNCGGEITNNERGEKFMALEDWENAVKAFEMAVWDEPDNPDIRLDYGLALDQARSSRKAIKQWAIAAKIGGSHISERFMDLARGENPYISSRDYDNSHVYRLALVADPENAEANLLLGKETLPSQKGLVYLREALKHSSSSEIVEPCFSSLKQFGSCLGLAYSQPVSSQSDGYEDFGPVTFALDANSLIWPRAKKNKWGRYNDSAIKLYSQRIGDSTANEIATVKSKWGFPCIAPDSSTIYYSDGRKIFRVAKSDSAPIFICDGVFPDLSLDGKKMLFSRNRKIYQMNPDSLKAEEIQLKGEYNFMPRFRHDDDHHFLFLSYRAGNLGIFQAALNGDNQKLISKVSYHDFDSYNPYRHNFDVSRDGKKLVFSQNSSLYLTDLDSLTCDTLWVYGAYPRFSPDAKQLSILMREYGPKGEVVIVDLEKYREVKAFFHGDDIDRSDMRKYLEAATRAYKVNEQGNPEFSGKW